LIAQRRLIFAERKFRIAATPQLYASVSKLVGAPTQELELQDVKKAVVTGGDEVRELKASLNRVMGWPHDTELELVPPDPLVENVSSADIGDKPASANLEV